MTSIDDASNQGASICALAGSAAAAALSKSYPKINYVPHHGSATEMLQSLRAGHCVGAVLGYADWEYCKVSKCSSHFFARTYSALIVSICIKSGV